MRFVRLGLAIVMLASSSAAIADTTCTYNTSYNDPYIHGECLVDAVEACPIHLVIPHVEGPVDLPVFVSRNGDPVTVTPTIAVVGAINSTVSNFDYYSCDCHRDTFVMQFDELAVTLPGTLAGDVVSFGDSQVILAPAATCAEPMWPTQVTVQLGGCDMCPVDPPPDHGPRLVGCSAAAPTGWAIPVVFGLTLGLTLGLARRRRGRARSARS